MTIRNTIVPVIAGLLVGGLVVPIVDVSVAIGAGAVATVLAVRLGGTTRGYALTGTLFTLGYGTLLWYQSVPTTSLAQLTLLVLGSLSLLFVGTKRGVKFVLQRSLRKHASKETVGDVWEVGATIGSGLYILWNALQATERILRTVLIALGGPTSLIVNVLSSPGTLEVPSWVFNVSLVVFVLAVVLAFHTIDTWRRMMALRRSRAVQATTKRLATGRSR